MTTPHPETLPDLLWTEFGSALQMLESAITACPADVWGSEAGFQEFWYIAYHTLFFTDFYGSESTHDFKPPPPFTLSELDPQGVFPERVYTKEELLDYLAFVMDKNRALIRRLTPEKAAQRFENEFQNFSLLHLVLFTTRHVQHHAAQLHLLLRQRVDATPGWVKTPRWALEG
ncbi:DinB family protein [Deinococcus koreensis]|uniref:DinB-like domain-containing protein n=1 Tax=Deinococcus koreensis TaxID=2054903 RepID=A0A2K3V2E7_9DEIO|nr:DinB family protein [Deinococcus koreensis]PNY82963.1 hypothetical protein CVO96_09200 [Deinococcus koreensis]